MVFGWGKKKEETEKATLAQEIQISEIMHALEEHKKSRQDRAAQESKPRFETIKKEIQSIFRIINNLKDDDLNLDDVDNRIKVIAVRGKAEIVETITKEAKTTIPDVRNYESMLKCTEVCSHILKKIGDVLGKNSRIVHIFAKKYANDLKTHLELVTKDHHAISTMISEYTSLDTSSILLKEKTRKIQATRSEINENTSHLDKLRNSLSDLDQTINLTQQKIADLFESPEYKKFMQYREQINHLTYQENKLNKEIDDEFSKISRPLGKYVYVTSLEKPLKIILENLLQSPSNTISQNKEAIVTILESCMKGIMSGSVSVKETDKAVDNVTHIIGLLDDFISRKNNLRAQIEDLQKKLAIFDLNDLENLEKQLNKSKSEKEDTKAKIVKLEHDLKQQITQKNMLVADLEGTLERVLKIKYKIALE